MLRVSLDRLNALAADRILILDGAMGTMIQRHKLTEADYRGDRFAGHAKDVKGNNDLLVLTQPQIIAGVHRQYLEAGADIIETNTFSSTSVSQGDYGLEAIAYELNVAAAKLARRVVDEWIPARARRQRRTQHMAWRKRTACALENYRLAVIRVFHQREYFAGKPQLARGQNRRRVAIIRTIGNQRARLHQMNLSQYAFIQIAMDHLMSQPQAMQVPRFSLVFINDYSGNFILRQLRQQRRDRWPVVENHYMV